MSTCNKCSDQLTPDARFCPRCGTAVVAVTRSASDPLVGRTIADRYLVLDKIGQGKSGGIYRAEHTTLHRKLALKVLHPELSRDEAAVERFRREATTIGQLDNDHLLQIADFGRTTDGRLFFAMELLEGETLDATLARDGKLAPTRAVRILIQIAEALEQAHDSGYIHRDLRPRNIFLSVRRGQRDFVKLLDFGLAKLVVPDVDTRQTALGMAFGDAHYMAPEQARGGTIDARSDVFSLGTVAYEMLTGSLPFPGSSPFDVVQKLLEGTPLRLHAPGVPPWLAAFVDKALEKEPADRFDKMGAIIACLRGEVAPADAPQMPAARIPATAAPLVTSSTRAATRPGMVKRTLAMPTALESSIAAAERAAVPPPDEPGDVEPSRRERDQTNPGRKQAFRDLPGHTDPSTLAADSVSGEVQMVKRPERVESATPSIVVEDATLQAETLRDEPTSPQRMPTMTAARQSAAATLVSPPDDEPRGEPTGPQHAVGDDGWFSDKAIAPVAQEDLDATEPRRDRGWILIAAIAGGVTAVAVVTFLVWPRDRPQDAAARPPVAVPEPPRAPEVKPVPRPVALPPSPVVVKPLPAAVVKPLPAAPSKADLVATPKPEPMHAEPPRLVQPPGVARPAESSKHVPGGFVDPFASAATSSEVDLLVRSGRQKLAAGDLAQAQSSFARARAAEPRNADAIAGLGEVAFEQGNYANAAALVRQALHISPNRARFLVLLGQACYKQGNAKDAVVEYKRALKVDPANQEASHSLEVAERKLAAEGK